MLYFSCGELHCYVTEAEDLYFDIPSGIEKFFASQSLQIKIAKRYYYEIGGFIKSTKGLKVDRISDDNKIKDRSYHIKDGRNLFLIKLQSSRILKIAR
jgi:hypothetical protein